MSTLKVHLEVAINLCAGVPVFPSYWEETERVARIIDSRDSVEKATCKGNPYKRSFPHFVEKHRWLRKLPCYIEILRQDTRNNLFQAADLHEGLVEVWFKALVGKYGFKAEYEIECPWHQGLIMETVSESPRQTMTA